VGVSSHGAGDDRASGISVASSSCAGRVGAAFAIPFPRWSHLAMSPSAFLREKAAKVGVTIGS